MWPRSSGSIFYMSYQCAVKQMWLENGKTQVYGCLIMCRVVVVLLHLPLFVSTSFNNIWSSSVFS